MELMVTLVLCLPAALALIACGCGIAVLWPPAARPDDHPTVGRRRSGRKCSMRAEKKGQSTMSCDDWVFGCSWPFGKTPRRRQDATITMRLNPKKFNLRMRSRVGNPTLWAGSFSPTAKPERLYQGQCTMLAKENRR